MFTSSFEKTAKVHRHKDIARSWAMIHDNKTFAKFLKKPTKKLDAKILKGHKKYMKAAGHDVRYFE